MKRIMIIGCGGAGKSTLARKLGEKTGLPVVHLDRIFWSPGNWVHMEKDEFDAALELEMGKDRWIIDGNYQRTLETRVAAADMVILLDLPTDVCMEGVKSRIGTKRPDLPWVEDELDTEFEQYVLDFQTNKMPGIYSILDKYHTEKQICVLNSRSEIDNFMKNL